MEKERKTAVEEVRNIKAVIKTEEKNLEEKAKDVLIFGVNRAHTLQYIIPEGKYSIESGINVNFSLIDSPVSEIIYHSDGLPIMSMVLRRRRTKAKKDTRQRRR